MLIGKYSSQYLDKKIDPELAYWLSQLAPGVPTISLINEYSKPKSKRSKLKIRVGWIGTGIFLVTKIILPLTGFISIPLLINTCSSKKINTEQTEIKKEKINNLEKTFYVNLDKTKGIDY